ncbi:hydantoinase/oxoprolinase family protein [Aquabacterium sp. J223]|uniref:hydantoinase/oxoprolinase family protein n=1 Tax=Aquabacterium sp. J223 TaxID=2898431 RepID=UPI0021ADE90A|nr:hydantoinase/oxoprolinase family protein [Aquabacterium sp. J223]UUX96155.1 hypothetical protein LRS07_02140 [Aquabacterium sp. J223]
MSRSTAGVEDRILAKQVDLAEIPIIDFAPFRQGGEAGRRAVAEAIAEACTRIGFFYLVGHGVPEPLLGRTFEQARAFFERPEAERRRSAATLQWYRGWIPAPKQVGPLDRNSRLFEQYRIQADFPDLADPDPVFHRPNRWPDDMPAFREACQAYYGAMLGLSRDLLHAFAIGLGLPEDRFDGHFALPICQLSLLHYSPIPDGADIEVSNTVSHTDEGPLTILAQDSIGGLEVKRRDGTWISAPPVPGAYTINIGDMMMWWSNGRFVSNYHRVRNKAGVDRYSIPFFLNPDQDTVVAPLPELIARDGGVARYEPVHVGTHLKRFYARLEKSPGGLPVNAAGARIGADIGGTFTDVVLETAAGRRHSTKVLTTHDAPERALLQGVATLLHEARLQPADVGLLVHGTTLATNALIERRGARTGLLTTDGFRDVLEMGTESRFDQYDLSMEKPAPLVPRRLRLPVRERMAADGQVLLPLDEAAVRAAAEAFRADGVRSVAVAFLHSYANPAHEQRAGALLREALPDVSVSLSCEVSPEMREYERFSTTAANAYVQPIVASYLGRLEAQLRTQGFACPLFLMLSSGGLTTVDIAARFPVRLVESGPAGGALFAAGIAAQRGIDRMLALDVGGTTAKICYIDDGRPQSSQVFEVARVHRFRKGSGLPLRIPVVEMVEIGAGGGSIAHVDGAGRLTVGPKSAGSEPGPACYGRGGTQPTVTDADLLLGRIAPDAFAGGRMHLDLKACEDAAAALPGLDALDARVRALGIGEIVDEAMASAARVHAVELGLSLEGRTLVAFGGCAPLHAARVAEKLGLAEVVVPPSAGVGSAVGFLRAPIAYEIARSLHQPLEALDVAAVNALLDDMSAQAHAIVRDGDATGPRTERRTAFARYRGQGHEIAIEVPSRALVAGDGAQLTAAFERAYRAHYGGLTARLPIEVLTWRVAVATEQPPPERCAPPAPRPAPEPAGWREVLDPGLGRVCRHALYRRPSLQPGHRLAGPALIVEDETTTVVSPAFDAHIDGQGCIVMRRRA